MSPRFRPPPSRIVVPQADEAATWQRVVLGLAGVLLVLAGVGAGVVGWYPVAPFTAIVVIAGAGLGLAAVRPPHGIARRLLVGVACLIMLVFPAGIAFIIWLIWVFRFD